MGKESAKELGAVPINTVSGVNGCSVELWGEQERTGVCHLVTAGP